MAQQLFTCMLVSNTFSTPQRILMHLNFFNGERGVGGLKNAGRGISDEK